MSADPEVETAAKAKPTRTRVTIEVIGHPTGVVFLTTENDYDDGNKRSCGPALVPIPAALPLLAAIEAVFDVMEATSTEPPEPEVCTPSYCIL